MMNSESISLLTEAQKNKIAGVLMDTNLQKELENTENHPDAWMLDFVYDSELRDNLFDKRECSQDYNSCKCRC